MSGQERVRNTFGHVGKSTQINISSSIIDIDPKTPVSFHPLWQTLINMAYCCLILLGKTIQKIVFGELRISEQQVR